MGLGMGADAGSTTMVPSCPSQAECASSHQAGCDGVPRAWGGSVTEPSVDVSRQNGLGQVTSSVGRDHPCRRVDERQTRWGSQLQLGSSALAADAAEAAEESLPNRPRKCADAVEEPVPTRPMKTGCRHRWGCSATGQSPEGSPRHRPSTTPSGHLWDARTSSAYRCHRVGHRNVPV